MDRVGIVGLGLLGTAVASRLLEGGMEVAGYDVRAQQAHALASAGLRAAENTARVVTAHPLRRERDAQGT